MSTLLAEFLFSRRSLLDPARIGLETPAGVGRRRVSGLRREEVAMLAGVSVEYYTRMEQGRVDHPSPAVLAALAEALRLDAGESHHLMRLCRQSRQEADCVEEIAHPVFGLVLGGLRVPGLVIGRRLDVLAWNDAAAAVFADFAHMSPLERNMARFTFLAPQARELYGDWELSARTNVGYLREILGRHPHDAALAGLVAELMQQSEEFRVLWQQHPVEAFVSGVQTYRHPVVGEFELSWETLKLGSDLAQSLMVFDPSPGVSTDRLQQVLLAH